MNNKMLTILSLLGSLLILLGIILLIPLSLSLIYGEGIFEVYLIPSLLALSLGLLLRSRDRESEISLATGMIICALGWIVISLVGALVFYLALDYSYIDSLFETVSGFAAAGLTVFTGLNELPKSILFWRALIQWVSGLGFLTFFLIVTFRGQAGLFQLFTAESHKIDLGRPVPNIFRTIKILWSIYLFFTLLEFLVLSLLGVSYFDAIIHSFTTLSTGGFSNYDQNIAYFSQAGYKNYKQIEYAIIFFMSLGGINFLIHYKVLTGKIDSLWKSLEMKYFWGMIFGGTGLILFSYYLNFNFNLFEFEETFRKTIFQVVSILTTTGYSTKDINSPFFTSFARQIFLVFMFTGACVGSTSGGFKLFRIGILNGLFTREIKKVYSPKGAVMPVVIDGSIIPDDEIFRIVSIFFSWLFLILVGGGITAFYSDLPAWNAFSGILSALGNIGPFYFSVEKMQELSDGIKITYIIAMLAGRLEILPLFIIFNRRAWRG